MRPSTISLSLLALLGTTSALPAPAPAPGATAPYLNITGPTPAQVEAIEGAINEVISELSSSPPTVSITSAPAANPSIGLSKRGKAKDIACIIFFFACPFRGNEGMARRDEIPQIENGTVVDIPVQEQTLEKRKVTAKQFFCFAFFFACPDFKGKGLGRRDDIPTVDAVEPVQGQALEKRKLTAKQFFCGVFFFACPDFAGKGLGRRDDISTVDDSSVVADAIEPVQEQGLQKRKLTAKQFFCGLFFFACPDYAGKGLGRRDEVTPLVEDDEEVWDWEPFAHAVAASS